MTNVMSPEDHLRARIESQRQEIERLRDQRDSNLAKEVELVEQLRADISEAYDLRDKAEGRYCTALGEIERLQKQIEILQRANRFLSEQIPSAHEPVQYPAPGEDHPDLRKVSDSVKPFEGKLTPEPSEWRCVCGELKVWAYTTKIETATTIHRTDGPCYQRDGASRDASSEKSETVKDSCGPGCAMGANRPAQTSDEIRDLACCDKFVRESASEFCATCGYTNLDHLRKRSSSRTSE